VETGQTFRISITPDSDSFCYVLLYSDGKFFILHDEPLQFGKPLTVAPLLANNTPGRKSLYVIMSLARQENLENIIKNYRNNPEKEMSKLHETITGLQQVISNSGRLSQPPIPTGGTVSSVGRPSTGVASQETSFSGRNIYVSTFSIRITSP